MYLDQLFHPDSPWLTGVSTSIIDSWISTADRGLEFGSGRSTLWFAKRVKKLTSVEHDRAWFERITKELQNANVGNVDYVFRPVCNSGLIPNALPYWGVAEELPDHSLDFVLVDGAERSKCALASLDKIKPGGILIIDNVNWALPSRSRSPASRSEEQGPVSDEWALFLTRVAGWRRIWTSNGVTDTAIYLRGPVSDR
ncbi:MAG: class I SAM-dependent methyltransferase [Gammaproteobacteria bacterium]|nr:class I SAM-dependent methyltransferase [Gammaproteobacteria bacterium]